MKVLRSSALLGTTLASALVLAACGSDNNATTAGGVTTSPPGAGSSSPSTCARGSLSGAGSSFQDPVEQQWITAYGQQCSGARVNYSSVGSGTGISQFGSGTIDFAGSDVVMKADEQSAADKRCGGKPAIHIPISAGGVAVTWNLPNVPALQLSPDTLAAMFQGTITKWNDAAIKADNPSVNLPSTAVSVVYRSDGSGTNAVFTSYLAAASPAWKLGSGKTVKWPVGQGAKGNQGVSAAVAQTVGGLTYTEQAFAEQHKLPTAKIKNAGGGYVELTSQNVSTALQSLRFTPKSPNDLSATIDYKPTDPKAYPISTLTYVIVCSGYPAGFDATKVALLKDFLAYGVTTGQQSVQSLGFAPLPDTIVTKDKASISAIS